MTRKGFSDADREKGRETQREDRDRKKQEFPDALLKYNGNLYRACAVVGTSRRQYYTWRTEDEEFRKATDDIWESVKDDLESLLIDIGGGKKKGNVAAVCAVLNARARDRGYGVSRQELTGASGGPVTFSVVFVPWKAST